MNPDTKLDQKQPQRLDQKWLSWTTKNSVTKKTYNRKKICFGPAEAASGPAEAASGPDEAASGPVWGNFWSNLRVFLVSRVIIYLTLFTLYIYQYYTQLISQSYLYFVLCENCRNASKTLYWQLFLDRRRRNCEQMNTQLVILYGNASRGG